MSNISGLVVAATGANGGIGAATATLLAERGAKLVLGARRQDRIDALSARIAAQGGEAVARVTDVRRREDLAALVDTATGHFGRLDVLVSNAGLATISALDDLRVDEWDAMIDVNVKGVLHGIAAALPVFRRQVRGHFVNIASTAAHKTAPNQAVCSATKAAVLRVSEGLRQEAGDSLRVTVVSPGFVRTELVEHIADPETRAHDRGPRQDRDPARGDRPGDRLRDRTTRRRRRRRDHRAPDGAGMKESGVTSKSQRSVHRSACDIPPPASISVAAREVLAHLCDTPAPSDPPPGDADAWSTLIEAREAKWQKWNDTVLATAPCRTETASIGGVTVYVSEPAAPDPRLHGCTYLYLHGGAFVFGAGRFAKAFGAMTAVQLGIRTIAVDYRMPPTHPCPASLDDCFAVYRAVVAAQGSSSLFLGGDSSGANLAVATILKAREHGLSLPASAAILTPVLDLTASGDTIRTNRDIDVVMKQPALECFTLYAGDHDRTSPYLSPLTADFARGFPPTFVQSGTRDPFLSDAVRFHRALRAAAIDAELNVWEAMPHGGFGVEPTIPENADVYRVLGDFLARMVGEPRDPDGKSATRS